MPGRWGAATVFGPLYGGDSHRHLEITEEERGAFMDDVRQTLNKFDVPPPVQEELTAIIESTHDAIVISRLQSATP